MSEGFDRFRGAQNPVDLPFSCPRASVAGDITAPFGVVTGCVSVATHLSLSLSRGGVGWLLEPLRSVPAHCARPARGGGFAAWFLSLSLSRARTRARAPGGHMFSIAPGGDWFDASHVGFLANYLGCTAGRVAAGGVVEGVPTNSSARGFRRACRTVRHARAGLATTG